MALFSVEPCPKCKADAWRLIGRGPRPGTAELTCVFCGTNIILGDEIDPRPREEQPKGE